MVKLCAEEMTQENDECVPAGICPHDQEKFVREFPQSCKTQHITSYPNLNLLDYYNEGDTKREINHWLYSTKNSMKALIVNKMATMNENYLVRVCSYFLAPSKPFTKLRKVLWNNGFYHFSKLHMCTDFKKNVPILFYWMSSFQFIL